MSTRSTIWIARANLVVCVVVVMSSALLHVLVGRAPTYETDIAAIGFETAFLIFAVIGALIVTQHPGHRIGWLFCAIGFVWTTPMAFGATYATYAIGVNPGVLPAGRWAGWISGWSWIVGLGLIVTYLLLLFPDGRLLSPRWRVAGWLAAAGMTIGALSFMFHPGELPDVDVPIDNPAGVASAEALLEISSGIATALLATSAVASVLSLIVRLRRSRGIERQQLKWVGFAASIAGTGFLISVVTYVISEEMGDRFAAVAGFSTFAIPIAAGIAILRHRLYDIDVIINRTVVYALLTGSLLVVYLVLVLVLGSLMRTMSGESSSLVTAASTLAVAAFFQPARRRIQRIVDQHFNRSRYDAARTLDAFSARLREQIDLRSLSGELTSVVTETMQPAHVSLWLRSTAYTRSTVNDGNVAR